MTTENEIEVTPTMIEAGHSAIDPIDWSILRGGDEFYRAIFLAMVDVALREGRLRPPPMNLPLKDHGKGKSKTRG